MKTLWQGLIACAALGAGAYFVHANHVQQASLSQAHAEMEALAREVAEGRRDAATRAGAPAARWRPVAPDSTPEAAVEPAPSAAPEASPASAPRPAPVDTKEMRAHLDSKFADERSDAGWAVASQRVAATKLTQALPATSELRSVECHASMCKIETTHQDVEHYRQFARSALIDPRTAPWNGAYFSTAVQDPESGKLTAVAYLAREGEQLPLLE